MNARMTAACVRALRLIDTKSAKQQLERYISDQRLTVMAQLAHAMNSLEIPFVRQAIAEKRNLPNSVRHQITDLRPLATLTDLRTLAGLASLETLGLSRTQVHDIAPLAKLANLQVLRLHGTHVDDVNALGGLSNLQTLDLEGTQVTDVSPLVALTKLRRLRITGTRIGRRGLEDLRSRLPDLEVVDLPLK